MGEGSSEISDSFKFWIFLTSFELLFFLLAQSFEWVAFFNGLKLGLRSSITNKLIIILTIICLRSKLIKIFVRIRRTWCLCSHPQIFLMRIRKIQISNFNFIKSFYHIFAFKLVLLRISFFPS